MFSARWCKPTARGRAKDQGAPFSLISVITSFVCIPDTPDGPFDLPARVREKLREYEAYLFRAVRT